MGASTTKQSSFNQQEWTNVLSDGPVNILANKSNPNIKIAQHNFKANSEKEYKKANKLYKLRKDSPNIVQTVDEDLTKGQGCTSTYSGQVYTQWIPITLQNVAHVPFPDVLHIYKQAFDGADVLSNAKGSFKMNEDSIGINTQDIVKVYHSPDFSQVKPSHRLKSEEEMVHHIITAIEHDTDFATMPRQQPSIKKFIYDGKQTANLDQAKGRLQEYARIFNRGNIPDHLACVRKVGGAEAIRSKWISQPGVTNHSFTDRKLQSNPQMIHTSSMRQNGSTTIVQKQPMRSTYHQSVRTSYQEPVRTINNQSAHGNVRNEQLVHKTMQLPLNTSSTYISQPQRTKKNTLYEQKQTEQRFYQQKVHQQRMNQQRVNEQRGNQQRGNEKRMNEQMLNQQRMNEQRRNEQRMNEQRMNEQRMNEQMLNQQRVNEQRMNEQMLNQQRVNEQRANEQRINEQRVDHQRMHEQRMNQQRINQQRVNEQRIRSQLIQHERVGGQVLSGSVQKPYFQRNENLNVDHKVVKPVSSKIQYQSSMNGKVQGKPIVENSLKNNNQVFQNSIHPIQQTQSRVNSHQINHQTVARSGSNISQLQTLPPIKTQANIYNSNSNLNRADNHNANSSITTTQNQTSHISNQPNLTKTEDKNPHISNASHLARVENQTSHISNNTNLPKVENQTSHVSNLAQSQNQASHVSNNSHLARVENQSSGLRPPSNHVVQAFPRPLAYQQPIVRQSPSFQTSPLQQKQVTPISSAKESPSNGSVPMGSSLKNEEPHDSSMSSIGISNVPNPTNKDTEQKFFSEIRQESINNTTRNFYNTLINQDSQLDQNYDYISKKVGASYEDNSVSYKDNGVSYKDNGVSYKDSGASYKDSGASYKDNGASDKDSGALYKDSGASYKDGGTSEDFLEQLKGMSSSLKKQDYSSTYNYKLGNNDDYASNYSSKYNQNSNNQDYGTSNKYEGYATSNKYEDHAPTTKYEGYETSSKYEGYETSNKYEEYTSKNDDYDITSTKYEVTKQDENGVIAKHDDGAHKQYSHGVTAYSFGNTFVPSAASSPNKAQYELPSGVESGKVESGEVEGGEFGSREVGSSNGYTEYTSYNTKLQGQDYMPTYQYESQKEYREYNGNELEYGYKTSQHAYNNSYEISTQNLLSGEREKKKLDDGLEMKYSVMEREQNEEDYTPQWDPEILADLQAKVHSN